jgi:hypothetical protein
VAVRVHLVVSARARLAVGRFVRTSLGEPADGRPRDRRAIPVGKQGGRRDGSLQDGATRLKGDTVEGKAKLRDGDGAQHGDAARRQLLLGDDVASHDWQQRVDGEIADGGKGCDASKVLNAAGRGRSNVVQDDGEGSLDVREGVDASNATCGADVQAFGRRNVVGTP